MKILVTRPAEDGAEIALRLAEMGHEALLAPLLAVRVHPGAALALDDVQAILATSANGVRALSQRTGVRDIPVFAVGPQTALAAERAGFLRVRSANGDAAALVEKTRHWAQPERGVLLHAAGAESGGQLAQTLSGLGFKVRREILYRVDAAAELPAQAARALEQGQLDAALFFSPRSARIFVRLITQAGIPTSSLVAICISANTAKALEGLQFSGMRVAATPDQAALLARL